MTRAKQHFVTVTTADQYHFTKAHIAGAVYVCSYKDEELYELLRANDERLCYGAIVYGDKKVVDLHNRGYDYMISPNTNIHVLKNHILTPAIDYDEAVTKVDHKAKVILWFGNLDGAISLKKAGVNVICYHHYGEDSWDFVDGVFGECDDEFQQYWLAQT